MEAQCKRFEVRAREDGRVLFSADEDAITIGAEKLKVTGTAACGSGNTAVSRPIRCCTTHWILMPKTESSILSQYHNF